MNVLSRVGASIGGAMVRAGAGIKSLSMRFAGRMGYAWTQLGATSHDYQKSVGNPAANVIVAATIRAMQRMYAEAPMQVLARNADDEETEVRTHPLAVLLRKPNRFYSGRLLWSATIADFALTGNAYWVKIRGGGGRVVELWWVPSAQMEPRWPEDGSEYISHYEYRIEGRGQTFAVEDVVHFRDGLDPHNIRKGLGALNALLREIATDNEAANWTASILRNMGVPGVVIAPSGDVEMQPEDAEEVKTQYMQKFGGDRKGDPLVMSQPTTVTVLGFNPQQMDLKALRRVPEERISAIFGIPAIVVGLGSGLDHATYSNYDTALTAAYTTNVIPTQALLAEEIQTQLVPDFGDADVLRVQFDYSNIRVLQADVNSLHAMAVADLQGGLITRNQALQMIGEAPEEGVGGDVLYVSTRVTPMLADDLLALREMPARVSIAEPPAGLPPPTPDVTAGTVPAIAPPAAEPVNALAGKSARVKAALRREFSADLADAVLDVLAAEHPGVSAAEHGRTVIEQAKRIAEEVGTR